MPCDRVDAGAVVDGVQVRRVAITLKNLVLFDNPERPGHAGVDKARHEWGVLKRLPGHGSHARYDLDLIGDRSAGEREVGLLCAFCHRSVW